MRDVERLGIDIAINFEGEQRLPKLAARSTLAGVSEVSWRLAPVRALSHWPVVICAPICATTARIGTQFITGMTPGNH